MEQSRTFGIQVIRDLIVIGLAGGLLAVPVFGLRQGLSFCLGCFWVALNFFLLAWLLSLILSPRRVSRLFILLIACAKIPASYVLLWWFYQIDYLEPVGVTVGLAVLPVVLLYRGLAIARAAATPENMRKEGK